MADAVRAASDLGVHVYPVASSGVDELTELTMRSTAQLTPGVLTPGKFLSHCFVSRRLRDMRLSMPSASGPPGRSHPRMRLVTPGPAPEPSDAELVGAVRAHAPLSALRVWERYATLVRRVMQRALGPSADVEDAVQDAFLRLFRDIDNLREPSALRSFLIGIALHVAVSELRRRRARRWLLLSHDGVLPDPEPIEDTQRLEQRETLRRLYAVLDRVDARHRMVFVLRYVEGLGLAELSAVLGCSLATTKRRVAEAAKRVTRLAAKDPMLAPYLPEKP